jgi:hypothetical protein
MGWVHGIIQLLLSQPVGKTLGKPNWATSSRSPNDSLPSQEGFYKTTLGWSFFCFFAVTPAATLNFTTRISQKPSRTAVLRLIKISLLAAITVAGLCFTAQAQAPLDIRIALVIGNSAYPGSPLVNPVNDSRAMGQALRRLGFTVVELENAQRQEMTQAVARVRDALKGKQGVGMLYYAGHGVQLDWLNYLVPVDARVRQPDDVLGQTVGIDSVMDAFKEAGNRMNIVVLDACRDNPFDDKLATKGLAPIDAPPGTFMAFATSAGNVAEDGDVASGNGLYTQFLLQELKAPAARLEDMFKRVKLQVRQKSEGRQVPSDSSNLDEAFSFSGGFSKATRVSEAARIERYQVEKAAWDRIKTSQSADDFFAFLRLYPSGFISEIAQFRVDQLKTPLLVPQLARDGLTTLASGKNRFFLGDEYTLITTDLITKIVRSEAQKVTFADNQRVEINNGVTVYDQMGGLIKDDSGVKDPAMLLVPADIALGKQWRSSFQNRISQFDARTYIDFKVDSLQDLDIAGTLMKAYKVDMSGFATVNGFTAAFKGAAWIEPQTMRLVRYDREVRYSGSLLDATRIEVTNYRPARRS